MWIEETGTSADPADTILFATAAAASRCRIHSSLDGSGNAAAIGHGCWTETPMAAAII
jgi:hypothetical protein